MVKATSAPILYQQDLVAWYDDTVAKLKAGEFAALDIEARIFSTDWFFRDGNPLDG